MIITNWRGGGGQVSNTGHHVSVVTGQLADKPTRNQSSRGLDNSRTGQLAEIFHLKFW